MKNLMSEMFEYSGKDSNAEFQRIISRYPAHKRKKVAREIIRGGQERQACLDDFFLWVADNPDAHIAAE